MPIGLTLKFEIKPGASEPFEAGFRKAAAVVKAQDEGCEMYDLFKSIDSPTTYVMGERWTTQALLDAHMKSPTMGGVAGPGPPLAGAPAGGGQAPGGERRGWDRVGLRVRVRGGRAQELEEAPIARDGIPAPGVDLLLEMGVVGPIEMRGEPCLRDHLRRDQLADVPGAR